VDPDSDNDEDSELSDIENRSADDSHDENGLDDDDGTVPIKEPVFKKKKPVRESRLVGGPPVLNFISVSSRFYLSCLPVHSLPFVLIFFFFPGPEPAYEWDSERSLGRETRCGESPCGREVPFPRGEIFSCRDPLRCFAVGGSFQRWIPA